MTFPAHRVHWHELCSYLHDWTIKAQLYARNFHPFLITFARKFSRRRQAYLKIKYVCPINFFKPGSSKTCFQNVLKLQDCPPSLSILYKVGTTLALSIMSQWISPRGGYSTLSWVRMCCPKFRPPPYNKTREDANLQPISKPFVSWRALS